MNAVNDAYVNLEAVARAITEATGDDLDPDDPEAMEAFLAMAAAAVAVRDEQWRTRLTERAAELTDLANEADRNGYPDVFDRRVAMAAELRHLTRGGKKP